MRNPRHKIIKSKVTPGGIIFDLDLLQYQFKTNELEEFIKENLKVMEIGNSEDIRFYLSLKKRESIE